jgi:hypothetical protein
MERILTQFHGFFVINNFRALTELSFLKKTAYQKQYSAACNIKVAEIRCNPSQEFIPGRDSDIINYFASRQPVESVASRSGACQSQSQFPD